MLRFILLRLLQAIPVLFVVVTTTFLLVHQAPGGPFDAEKVLPDEVLQKLNQRYNLDAPLHQQYFDYLSNAVHGDFGPSFRYHNRSVTELISSGLPVTFELALYALIFALVIGVGSGILAAHRPYTLQDHIPMTVTVLGVCMPSIIMGPLLALVFGIWLEWLPVSGWGYSPGDKILPSITLGSGYAAYIARLTRSSLLEELSQEYIRTAKAKGLGRLSIIIKHTLRAGLTPVAAYLGPAIAGLLAGSFVVETIFQIPGLGRNYVIAAFNRDYTMILGTTLLLSSLIILFNIITDIITAWLNPNTRYQR